MPSPAKFSIAKSTLAQVVKGIYTTVGASFNIYAHKQLCWLRLDYISGQTRILHPGELKINPSESGNDPQIAFDPALDDGLSGASLVVLPVAVAQEGSPVTATVLSETIAVTGRNSVSVAAAKVAFDLVTSMQFTSFRYAASRNRPTKCVPIFDVDNVYLGWSVAVDDPEANFNVDAPSLTITPVS